MLKNHESWLSFPYYCIRRISAPEDDANGRTVHSGKAPASSFIDIPDDENVRVYLLEAKGRQRNRATAVHRAIRETLQNTPEDFSVLNAGITIVAREVDIQDGRRLARLKGASVVNGSQTQGELKNYIENLDGDEDLPPVHVRFEIIETTNDDLIADISIARNFQNAVKNVTIPGRKGHFDELENALQRRMPNRKLQRSETDIADEFIETPKLLQVLTALVPAELWPKKEQRDNPNKVYTYSRKSRCLKDFDDLWNQVHDQSETNPQAEALYQFYLDMAGEAWELYKQWKRHQGFKGTGLQSLKRDNRGNIKEVPDGIVFPIMAALSEFAAKVDGTWTLKKPQVFTDDEIIQAAKDAYMEIADHNPQSMGKSKACYTQLRQITSIYRRWSEASA